MHSSRIRWVATPLCSLHPCLATGSGVWCRYAFRSLGDEPTSSTDDVARFVAPLHADFAPRLTGSPAACLPRVPTWSWSIKTSEAWSQRRRHPPLDLLATASTATRRSSPPSPNSCSRFHPRGTYWRRWIAGGAQIRRTRWETPGATDRGPFRSAPNSTIMSAPSIINRRAMPTTAATGMPVRASC